MKRAILLSLTACLAIGAPAAAKKKPDLKAVAAANANTKVEDFLPPPITADNTWNLDLSDGGRVVIQLRPDKAPKMVDRIRTLSRQGFYNNLTFHRVIDGFMAQGGDPKGTGEGGSTLPNVPAEFNDLPHVRGAVAAARAESTDSANSQFYVMFQPNLKLDRHYTVFGRVVSGMAYVDAIARGEPPANPTRVLRASIGNEAGNMPVPTTSFAPAAAAAAPGASPSGPVVPDPSPSSDQ